MKHERTSVCCALAAMTAWSVLSAELNDWENPAVNSRNREPARTYSMPLAAESDAFTDAIEPETPYRKTLNGIWKISWAGNPDLRVKDFYRTDYSDADWLTIDVPSCVEMRGFGSPGYVNIKYPHKMEWPFIKDRQTGRADYNPVSSYRRTFTVPEAWKGREVFLRFDGVYSAYYVWVNGEKVGYAEDSKLPSEFNVTKYLKPGENLLAVEVYRWCDGSYIEDQDMFRFSGIFRDVTLWSMPKDGIWDFKVSERLEVEKGLCKEASISLEGIDGEWTAALYDADKVQVASLSSALPSFRFPSSALPRLWSAEKPYLYTLVVKKGGDIRARKVGFKEVRIAGNTILVNGMKVKFKGVNRHETNPDNGRTVSLADMLKDITLFKKYNINTVRTCHYPDHHLWYDLCDRYGIYVVAEANVEAHEPGFGEKGLGRFPEWNHSIVERNLRNVLYHRNHPSVTLWSMGNETGHGDCFRQAIKAVKALDPSRPVHWERGNFDADVDSRMYPPVEWLDKRGQLGDGMITEAQFGRRQEAQAKLPRGPLREQGVLHVRVRPRDGQRDRQLPGVLGRVLPVRFALRRLHLGLGGPGGVEVHRPGRPEDWGARALSRLRRRLGRAAQRRAVLRERRGRSVPQRQRQARRGRPCTPQSGIRLDNRHRCERR